MNLDGDTDASHVDFWGEIAPCDHIVQIYQHDGAFLDALEGFVAGGIRAGDGLVIIATPAHAVALEERLANGGVPLGQARAEDRYIALDAEETLEQFMVDGWPDTDRFKQVVAQVMTRARGDGRRVRAFGEMVAVLWARGQNGATVRLEHLWHNVCRDTELSLFCAYPRSGSTADATASMREIILAHDRVVRG